MVSPSPSPSPARSAHSSLSSLSTDAYFDSDRSPARSPYTSCAERFVPFPSSSEDSPSRAPSSYRIGQRSSCRSTTSLSEYGDDRNERVAKLAESLEDCQTQIAELGRDFIGLKTAEQAAGCTTPTALRLYYQLPQDGSFPSRLPLFLVYQSSDGQHFHFPIVQEAGRWRVKYGESKKISYPNLVSLMRHHMNYLFASPYVPGAFDSFEVYCSFDYCNHNRFISGLEGVHSYLRAIAEGCEDEKTKDQLPLVPLTILAFNYRLMQCASATISDKT